MSVVLLVDDSPADRALFRTILTRAGHTVREASRGRDTITLARETRPHAIVLDVNLPDTDGHEVCRALRADPDFRRTPVLMLTVRDNNDDVLAGLKAGADDYVAKDADGEIVLARLHRLIQFRQLAAVAVLNEQLVQVGRLLAGIVHEIRGPLSVVRAAAEVMRLQLPPDNLAHQWVDPILKSTQLLQVRLEHLMATVRSGPAVRERVELAPLVRESTELFLKGTDPRGRGVRIETICGEGTPHVQADAGRLIQVLLALVGNAQEAIGGGTDRRDARVTVRTGTASDEGCEWVTIEVLDDGPGIPEAFLERIFEPFFTTKEGGSGFGLYLASEIVKEQGGRLTARTLPEGGACFTVWLVPATSDEFANAAPS